MIYFVFKLLISLVIGNWVYSEAVLMVPEFDRLARSFYQSVKIPTHDQWPQMLGEQSVIELEREIIPAAADVLPAQFREVTVFGGKIRALWRRWSFLNWWRDASSAVPRDFLTGEGIFVSPQESRRLFTIHEVEQLPPIKEAR